MICSNQRLGRLGGGEQADPGDHGHVVDAGLLHGGRLGDEGRALVVHDRQRGQLAGLDVRQGLGQGGEEQVDVAAEQVVDGQRAALVGDVDHLDLLARLEHQAGEVLRAAVAGRRVRQRLGLGLGGGEHGAGGRELQAVLDDQHHRLVGQLGDGGEVGLRVVGQRLEDADVGGQERGRRGHQRVAVRRRLGHHRQADAARGAGAVVDHEGLAGLGRQLLADQARDHVDAAAGGQRHHDLHGVVGVLVGGLGRGAQERRRRQQRAQGQGREAAAGRPRRGRRGDDGRGRHVGGSRKA